MKLSIFRVLLPAISAALGATVVHFFSDRKRKAVEQENEALVCQRDELEEQRDNALHSLNQIEQQYEHVSAEADDIAKRFDDRVEELSNLEEQNLGLRDQIELNTRQHDTLLETVDILKDCIHYKNSQIDGLVSCNQEIRNELQQRLEESEDMLKQANAIMQGLSSENDVLCEENEKLKRELRSVKKAQNDFMEKHPKLAVDIALALRRDSCAKKRKVVGG